MSNFLAVATVTATLKTFLINALAADNLGIDIQVTTMRPDSLGSETDKNGVNLYLYQVTPNLARRNQDLPTRRSGGVLVQQPQLALDLHYLLSFYGDEATLAPQRLFGATARTLHTQPLLTRQHIIDVVKADHSFLKGSTLAEQAELVRLTPLSLSLEELSKLWSVFFQTKHMLSVAYQASVVLIEGEGAPQPTLPVRKRNISVATFRQPVIEQVAGTHGLDEPLVAASRLRISGAQLRGDNTRVRFGVIDVTPPPEQVSDRQIDVQLPSDLRAGVQGVQIVQPSRGDASSAPQGVVESNIASFVLRPRITANVSNEKSKVSNGVTTCSADVTVTFTPPVAVGQRVVLLLNEWQTAPGAVGATYRFTAPAWDAIPLPSGATETATIVFPIAHVLPGAYLVRVQVDGAESTLTLDPEGHYTGPQVRISPPSGGTTEGGMTHSLRSTKINVKSTKKDTTVTFKGEVTVKDEKGEPVADALVAVTWTRSDGTQVEQTATTDADGVTPKGGTAGFTVSQPAGDGKREVILTVTGITKPGGYTFDPDNSQVLSKKAHE